MDKKLIFAMMIMLAVMISGCAKNINEKNATSTNVTGNETKVLQEKIDNILMQYPQLNYSPPSRCALEDNNCTMEDMQDNCTLEDNDDYTEIIAVCPEGSVPKIEPIKKPWYLVIDQNSPWGGYSITRIESSYDECLKLFGGGSVFGSCIRTLAEHLTDVRDCLKMECAPNVCIPAFAIAHSDPSACEFFTANWESTQWDPSACQFSIANWANPQWDPKDCGFSICKFSIANWEGAQNKRDGCLASMAQYLQNDSFCLKIYDESYRSACLEASNSCLVCDNSRGFCMYDSACMSNRNI